MKKIVVSILIIFISILNIEAQQSTFEIGDKVINLGVGVGNTIYPENIYTTILPPVSGSFEISILDGILGVGSLGVGGYMGFNIVKTVYFDKKLGIDYGWKYNNYLVGAIGNFHYPLLDNLDTYLGIIIGVDFIYSAEYGTFSSTVNTNTSNQEIWSLCIGARYYLTPNIAVMAEFGYGITYLNIGFSFKF